MQQHFKHVHRMKHRSNWAGRMCSQINLTQVILLGRDPDNISQNKNTSQTIPYLQATTWSLERPPAMAAVTSRVAPEAMAPHFSHTSVGLKLFGSKSVSPMFHHFETTDVWPWKTCPWTSLALQESFFNIVIVSTKTTSPFLGDADATVLASRCHGRIPPISPFGHNAWARKQENPRGWPNSGSTDQ